MSTCFNTHNMGGTTTERDEYVLEGITPERDQGTCPQGNSHAVALSCPLKQPEKWRPVAAAWGSWSPPKWQRVAPVFQSSIPHICSVLIRTHSHPLPLVRDLPVGVHCSRWHFVPTVARRARTLRMLYHFCHVLQKDGSRVETMSDADAIHKRGQALEDEFFHRVDEKLRLQLQTKMEREKSGQAIAEATGLKDQKLIDHLLDAGLQASTLAALTLVPGIFVAWADGNVSANERQGILGEALNRGLTEQTVAYRLIEQWLDKRPPQSLWKLWKEYASTVYADMPPDTARSLAKEILHQATAVAQASGGALGLRRVSAAEQAVLDEIASVAPVS